MKKQKIKDYIKSLKKALAEQDTKYLEGDEVAFKTGYCEAVTDVIWNLEKILKEKK